MDAYDCLEYQALVSAVRFNPHEDTPKLVAADWLAENGEEERACFIRDMCDRIKDDELGEARKMTVATQLIMKWFTLPNGSVPSSAVVDGNWLQYWPVDQKKQGNVPDPENLQLRIARGFASDLICPVMFLLKRFDTLYAREPVHRCIVNTWQEKGPDGEAIIRYVPDPQIDNPTGSFRVAGQAIRITDDEWLKVKESERKLAEAIFGKRWPGVEFQITAPEFG